MSDLTLESLEDGYVAAAFVLDSLTALAEGQTCPAEPGLTKFRDKLQAICEDLDDAWTELCKERGRL